MIISFWAWLFRGAPLSRAGWRNVIDQWVLLHAGIALLLTKLVVVDVYAFAAKALFPAASILVGMSVAWTSRAASVLQDKDFRNRVLTEERPLEDYLYGYQLSLLIIIIMVVFVSVTANGGLAIPFFRGELAEKSTSIWMYFLISMAIRECWSVINFSNLLSLLHSRM